MNIKKAMREGGQNTSNKSAYGEIRVEKNKLQEREESKEMGFNIVNLKKLLCLLSYTPSNRWQGGWEKNTEGKR